MVLGFGVVLCYPGDQFQAAGEHRKKLFCFMRGDSFFDQLINCPEGRRLLLICCLLSVFKISILIA